MIAATAAILAVTAAMMTAIIAASTASIGRCKIACFNQIDHESQY